jgi:hypothetical protein
VQIRWQVEYDGSGEDPVVRATTDVHGWTATVKLERQSGVVRVAGIELLPTSTEALLTTSVFKRLRLGELQGAVASGLETDPDIRFGLPDSWHTTRVAVPRPGRAGRSDLDYAIWARRYVQACEADPRAPIRRLVETFGDAEGGLAEAALRAVLHEARRRGLLTRAAAGVAGGRLTRKADALLKRITKEGD